MRKLLSICLLLICLGAPSGLLHGQSIDNDDALLQKAENFFRQKNFLQALRTYNAIKDERKGSHPYIYYKIGLCYLQSPNQKDQATSYLEYALKNMELDRAVPPEVYYYLASCYQRAYRYQEAIDLYQAYQHFAGKGYKLELSDAERQIEICHNGISILEMNQEDISVEYLRAPINSSFDEQAPVIRPNGALLLYSSDRNTESIDLIFGDQYVFLPDSLRGAFQSLLFSYRRGIDWDVPQKEAIAGVKIYPLSFRNAGSELLLYMENEKGEGDLYISKYKDARLTNPKKLSSRINSEYTEMGACFAMNGKALYFSSNRPGGSGGYDLYVSYDDGRDWSKPVNLGTMINTSQDEITPFMLPDEKTFFFSSNGHNSIGGYDIFKTSSPADGQWTTPTNMGMPVNSPYDETFFVQRADGRYSYFTTNRNDIHAMGGNDIMEAFKRVKQNPIALVYGKMVAKKDGISQEIKLRVFDKATGQEQFTVYNPSLDSGDYFIILKPRKNYELHLLLAEGHTYVIDLSLPEDTYSYRLDQHINLSPFKLLGSTIGEHSYIDAEEYELKTIHEAEGETDIRYDHLTLLIDRIMDAQDIMQLRSLNDLDNAVMKPTNKEEYDFYTPLVNRVHEAIESGNTEELRKLKWPLRKEKTIFYGKRISNRKLVASYQVVYDAYEQLDGKSQRDLLEIIQTMSRESSLKIDIIYTDAANGKEIRQIDALYNFLVASGLSEGRIAKVKETVLPVASGLQIRLYEENAFYD